MMSLEKTQKTIAGRKENNREGEKMDGKNERKWLDDRFLQSWVFQKRSQGQNLKKEKNINSIH